MIDRPHEGSVVIKDAYDHTMAEGDFVRFGRKVMIVTDVSSVRKPGGIIKLRQLSWRERFRLRLFGSV